MDNLFQSKWFIRVISLVLAVSLYLFATYEPDTSKHNQSLLPSISKEVQVLNDIPLKVKIDSENYVVSGVPEYVTVTLEGRASVLAPVVRQKNFNMYVDLTELEEGEHLVAIEYENIPDDISVYIEPKTIEVVIEKRASKEFAVEVDFVNLDRLPVDYEIGEVTISPETVNIVSSSNVIERVALVKVYIDVTDLKESIRHREVPISVSDIQGNDLNVRIEPESAVVSVQIDRPSKRVPVQVKTKGQLREELEIASIEATTDVDIFAKRARLNEIEFIETEPIDLSLIESSVELEVPFQLPENVVANTETVKVKINLEETKVFESVGIETVGLDGRIVTFESPENGRMIITAIGDDKLISELKRKDIIVRIDITDLEIGRHQVDIEVTGPENIIFEKEFERATIEIHDP